MKAREGTYHSSYTNICHTIVPTKVRRTVKTICILFGGCHDSTIAGNQGIEFSKKPVNWPDLHCFIERWETIFQNKNPNYPGHTKVLFH